MRHCPDSATGLKNEFVMKHSSLRCTIVLLRLL
jgi:hypothetical protein